MKKTQKKTNLSLKRILIPVLFVFVVAVRCGRCARYAPTQGCTMVTDPRDSCCLAPFCQPVLPPTAAPNHNPDHPATPSPIRVPIPTAIPGVIVGNSVNNPNTNNPNNESEYPVKVTSRRVAGWVSDVGNSVNNQQRE